VELTITVLNPVNPVLAITVSQAETITTVIPTDQAIAHLHEIVEVVIHLHEAQVHRLQETLIVEVTGHHRQAEAILRAVEAEEDKKPIIN